MLGHDDGVGVEVEQPPAELLGGRDIALVLEPQAAAQEIGAHGQLDDARPVGQAQAAPVELAVDLLDARHGARGQPGQQRAAVERGAEGQAHDEIVDHPPTVPASAGGHERGAAEQQREAEQAHRA